MCDAIDENATDDKIEILRNGLIEFPNNLYLLYRLPVLYMIKYGIVKTPEIMMI